MTKIMPSPRRETSARRDERRQVCPRAMTQQALIVWLLVRLSRESRVESSLHEEGIDPSTVLKSDLGEPAGMDEAR